MLALNSFGYVCHLRMAFGNIVVVVFTFAIGIWFAFRWCVRCCFYLFIGRGFAMSWISTLWRSKRERHWMGNKKAQVDAKEQCE